MTQFLLIKNLLEKNKPIILNRQMEMKNLRNKEVLKKKRKLFKLMKLMLQLTIIKNKNRSSLNQLQR